MIRKLLINYLERNKLNSIWKGNIYFMDYLYIFFKFWIIFNFINYENIKIINKYFRIKLLYMFIVDI